MSESVFANDLHIKGEVTGSGYVELRGTLDGDITCRTLLITENAKVDGKTTAEKVVVRGTVEGQIHGIQLTLTSSARVKGELVCKALSVDEEAYFDGTTHCISDFPDQGDDNSFSDKGGDENLPLATSASAGH
jgi:cytoskeletal protein CcmA (bactofilin family)